LGTDERRGTTFRSSTDEIFETIRKIKKLDEARIKKKKKKR
jgi:hypothetical protein